MAHVLTNEELLEQFDLALDGDALKEENGAEITLKKYDNVLRAIDDYIYGIQRNAFFAGFRAGYAYAGREADE